MTGTIGMPLLIRDVIQMLAELRKTTTQVIIQTVWANLVRLIHDDLWLSASCGRLFEMTNSP